MLPRNKAKCANMSILSNDVAAGFGLTAALSGLFSPGSAALYGAASAFSWYAGNRWGQLSADPPRADFDTVDRFERVELALSAPETEFEATLQGFAGETLQQTGALTALVASLERFDGAEAVLNDPNNPEREKAAEFLPLQREAAEHNLAVVRETQGNLLEIGPKVNSDWSVFRTDNDIPQRPPSDQEKQAAIDVWEERSAGV